MYFMFIFWGGGAASSPDPPPDLLQDVVHVPTTDIPVSN